MQSSAKTVTAYLASLDPEQRRDLTVVRRLIKRTVPAAVEYMDYGMACYEGLVAFAAQKHYLAIYIADSHVMKRHRSKLPANTGKCCIRFRTLKQLPLDVIEQMLSETDARRTAGITQAMCDHG